MTSVKLFGIECEPCGPNDPDIIGVAAEVDGRIIRPPLSVAKSVSKIAYGQTATLAGVEIKHMKTLGIPIKELPRDSQGRFQGHVATVPVRITAHFRPVRR